MSTRTHRHSDELMLSRTSTEDAEPSRVLTTAAQVCAPEMHRYALAVIDGRQ